MRQYQEKAERFPIEQPNVMAKTRAEGVARSTAQSHREQLKGIFLGDTVSVFGQRGYVSGFTGTSGFYVKTIDNEYIKKPGKTYKQVGYKDITFISHNNNWQLSTRKAY